MGDGYVCLTGGVSKRCTDYGTHCLLESNRKKQTSNEKEDKTMTRNMHREMIQQEMIRKLQREKRLLAIQKEALILLSVGLSTILGLILVSL